MSRDPKAVRVKLREQMEIYSYQFKTAITTFQKDAVAISGKVGGMKDDICICLQLACYFTQVSGWFLCFIVWSWKPDIFCVFPDGAAKKHQAHPAHPGLTLQYQLIRITSHTQPTLA